MDKKNPTLSLSDYIFLYQWKRTLTDVDLKRRRAEKRERDRMHIRIIDKIASPTLSFEVENFKLFGDLKKTETEIHNTVPSNETVTAERDYIEFENMRRRKPHAAHYKNFYGCIQSEANKPRTPSRPTSVALSGIENHPLLSARTSSDLSARPRSLSQSLTVPETSRRRSKSSNLLW
ncbi:hypothetical protein ACF0H5_010413 [Mactra antiquata]